MQSSKNPIRGSKVKVNARSEVYTSVSKFFASLVFVYKSMSLKRFRIEELCPSIDRMISLAVVHYAVMLS